MGRVGGSKHFNLDVDVYLAHFRLLRFEPFRHHLQIHLHVVLLPALFPMHEWRHFQRGVGQVGGRHRGAGQRVHALHRVACLLTGPFGEPAEVGHRHDRAAELEEAVPAGLQCRGAGPHCGPGGAVRVELLGQRPQRLREGVLADGRDGDDFLDGVGVEHEAAGHVQRLDQGGAGRGLVDTGVFGVHQGPRVVQREVLWRRPGRLRRDLSSSSHT